MPMGSQRHPILPSTHHAVAFLPVWLLICGGCDYQKRVVWSPDGDLAALIGGASHVDYTLFLCDTNGSLSPSSVKDVYRAAWSPDSTALVAAQSFEPESWAEICDLLPVQTRNRVIDAAEAIVQESDSVDSLSRMIHEMGMSETYRHNPGERLAIKYCIRDHFREEVGPKLPHALEHMHDIPLHALFLCTVTNQLPHAGPRIAVSLDPIMDLRVSPCYPFVAYTTGRLHWTLYVASLKRSGEIRCIAEDAAYFPDWRQNGKDLIFAVARETVSRRRAYARRLGRISGAHVIRDDGQEFCRSIQRYGFGVDIVMDEMVKVRTLRDGGILFTAIEVALPSEGAFFGSVRSLFLFDRKREPAVDRVVPSNGADVSSECIGLFELSPDNASVLIPGRGGAVSYMDLSSGNVVQLAEGWRVYDSGPYGSGPWGFDGEEILSVPTWRTASEVCYVRGVTPGAQHVVEEVVLHAIGTDAEAKSISHTWPRDAVSWLGRWTRSDD